MSMTTTMTMTMTMTKGGAGRDAGIRVPVAAYLTSFLTAFLPAFLPACLAALASMAIPALAQDAGLRVITMTIASSGAHKECVSLTKTQGLHYWFRADAPVDFNIQYQDAGGVIYPVRREKLTKGTGTYAAKAAEVHCMVLTNPARKPVTVRLEFARLER